MKLIISIKDEKNSILQLKSGKRVFDELHLTVSQGFDTLLIRTIDKILARNRIDRLLLKSLEIRGKLRLGTVSGMVLQTVRSALGV